MRRIVLALVAAAALAVAGSGSAATTTVRITKSGFSPANVTVNFGDTVTWTNNDNADHQLVADDGTFASPILKPGKSYSFTFRRAGTFRYHDALKPSLRGRVTVKGPPPSLTFGASLPIVTYGTQVTLTGTVSNKRAGETVTLFAMPYPQTSPVQLASVLTGANGTFTYTVTPELYTVYEAHWKNAVAGGVTLQVAPKMTLTRGRNGWFKTKVSAGAHSFAGRAVLLQRYNRAFSQWVTVRTLKLGSLGGRQFKIKVSGLPIGKSSFRTFMTVNQAGAGYLAAHSGSQPVTRRR
jgi:plastocyanin